MANVRFLSVKLRSTFDALETKDSMALYWIEETQELYKGSTLYGTGAFVTEKAAGILSPEDYTSLKSLIASGGGIGNLTAVDGTITLVDTENGGKSIGVAIADKDGNALTAVDGGLFVPTVSIPEYAIEKQSIANEGYSASYRLKKTIGDEISYVGDTINIAKDMVLKSATLETVTENDVPYVGAVVGEPYIQMVFNNADASNLYIPVKGLVDKFEAGTGISIDGNVIGVKIAADSHGLAAVDGSMTMLLATHEQDGAISKQDKKFIDSIPSAYVVKKYEVSDTPYGTIVNYGEKEIRIMCPANTNFEKQAVGAGGDENSYYVTFKTYVPDDSVAGYIEHLNGEADAEILTNFSVDEYGRRYQPTWLSVSKYDEASGTWNYYGVNSTTSKFVGWDYRIDWYNADNVRIATDSIRINLSNEDCHNYVGSYYGPNDYISAELSNIKDTVAEIEDSYTWGEM